MINKSKNVVCLGCSSGKNVLKKKDRININPPPPVVGRCDCCGRYISDLRLFLENIQKIYSGLKYIINTYK